MAGLRIMKLGLVLFLVLGVKGAGIAVEVPELNKPKKVTQEKIVEGNVVAISPNFIAINYGLDKKTSYEMALAIDKDTKVERKKSLKEILPQEGVWVKYAEITEVFQDTVGAEKKNKARVLARVAKVVRFMNPAPKEQQFFDEMATVEAAAVKLIEKEVKK
ncbi:MAG: hypothetical protein PHS66_04700 [Candidatus Omnitrophica bacterium]|nr:hypothetical protein [Candidatus Omnitrophota bacterium]